MAAPTPEPTALKKLRGTYRKDRAAKNEMQPATLTTVPMPPAVLNSKGAEVWYTAAGELQKLGMLHAVDQEMLLAYCQQVQRMYEAEFYIKQHGAVLKSKNKNGSEYYQKNPWLGIYNEALSQANRLATQFGFTPSARSRISAPVQEKPKADPWSEL